MQCTDTSTCKSVVQPLGSDSVCIDGICSNPFQQGCLHSLLGPEAFPDQRVCNSDDPDDAASKGLCSAPTFDYKEIRISNQIWDAPKFSSWAMQILLSELLQVPTTIETFSPDLHFNFYDPYGRSDSALKAYAYDALRKSHEKGDCRKVRSKICSHVFPMVARLGQKDELLALYDKEVIALPRGSGNTDQYRWWIPKRLAKEDPSLQSYYALSGDSNRKKLAKLFQRPTTWSDYCNLVSLDKCAADNGIAARAPIGEDEAARYFVDGLYTGHFRATDKNNCTLNPNSCSGHIANVPCEWATYVVPQAYHLNISLESDGKGSDGNYTNNGGYNMTSLVEIWAAANATGSNVIMYWWEPDALIEKYSGTEYEFTPIYLPPTTAECEENRVSAEQRCSENFEDQIGSPLGACQTGPGENVIVTTLKECEDDDDGICSPAYDTLQAYEFTNFNLQQIFQYRLNNPGQDRLAVCMWFAENLEYIKEQFVPSTYPRKRRKEAFYQPYTYFTVALAALSIICVLACAFASKKFQKTKVMIYAQVDFLLIILSGLTLVGVSALLWSIVPSKAVCTCRVWSSFLGYSLEVIPLTVKVAAINRIVQQSKRMKKVQIRKTTLYGIVGASMIFISLYLTVWTVIDPMVPTTKMTLTNELQNGTRVHIVQVSTFCASSTKAWLFGGIVYLLVILLVSAAIATQNRGIRQEFNEARYLALMIYSNFVFTVLRLIVHIFDELFVQQFAVSATLSLLLSVDTLITIAIYFLPKLYRAAKEHFGSRVVTKNQRTQPQEKKIPVDTEVTAEERNEDSSTHHLQQEDEHVTVRRKNRQTFTWHVQESDLSDSEDNKGTLEGGNRKLLETKEVNDPRSSFWRLQQSDHSEVEYDDVEQKELPNKKWNEMNGGPSDNDMGEVNEEGSKRDSVVRWADDGTEDVAEEAVDEKPWSVRMAVNL